MSPSAITELAVAETWSSDISYGKGILVAKQDGAIKSVVKRSAFLLDRHLHKEYPVVVTGKGNKLYTNDGRVVFDASGGAAVSCLGHGHERVIDAVCKQMKSGVPYVASAFWGNSVADELCKELISGTDHQMARVYLTGSGRSYRQTVQDHSSQM